MRLSMNLPYAGGFKEAVQKVADLERAGLDVVWIGEAYSFDSISQMGYLAAKTDTVQIGAGIVNVFSRTAALVAMTFAGLDYVSDGRAICGLGASGPQVVEGFHGVPYQKPLTRIREYIDVCRTVWKREPLVYDGETVKVPVPEGEGTGLGKPLKIVNHPVRSAIPIWWASLTNKAVQATAEVADGWLPIMFIPERAAAVWGDDLKAGLAKRAPDLGPLEIAAGGILAIGEDLVGPEADRIRDLGRAQTALYVGGMGARGKNFYNDLFVQYGYEAEAREIQELFLGGHQREAVAKVPDAFVDEVALVGTVERIRDRLAAWRESGATSLLVSTRDVATLRGVAEAAS